MEQFEWQSSSASVSYDVFAKTLFVQYDSGSDGKRAESGEERSKVVTPRDCSKTPSERMANVIGGVTSNPKKERPVPRS